MRVSLRGRGRLLGAVVGALGLAAAGAPAGAQTVYDPVNNRSYVLDGTARTWADARAAAVAAGGNLISIGNQLENDIANSLVGDGWIGMTDDAAFGGTEFGNTSANPYPPAGDRGNGWVWSDASPVTFQNWGGGEPNNAGAGENFANIRGDGAWNDLPATSTLPAVQEFAGRRPGSFFQGREYLILPPTTFANAHAQARALGGNLVSITSAEENAFVDGLVDGSTLIGFTDDEAFGGTENGNTSGNPYPPAGNRGAGWVWTDLSPVTFQNWNAGEPNDVNNEDIAELLNGGLWNDNASSVVRPAVIEIIPEPGSAALLGVGALAVLARRRRQ